jgi:SAM-dependent methyltransferase
LFFQRKTDLLNSKPKKMLHFAPERAFIKLLSRYVGEGYITADLYQDAMVKVDITDIKFPDDAFDVIYCVHVLEHIVDDIKAINELSRVLKADGWALIVVPINREKTFEDKNIIDSTERLKIFGQEDHVRICGIDYIERLESNGFEVQVYKANDITTDQEQALFGLKDDTLYYCTKRVSGN